MRCSSSDCTAWRYEVSSATSRCLDTGCVRGGAVEEAGEAPASPEGAEAVDCSWDSRMASSRQDARRDAMVLAAAMEKRQRSSNDSG